jgi:glucose-induced degradation protein 4
MLSGTITARNVPHQVGPITTFWTGEVIDMTHHNFSSQQHNTDEGMDWNQWRQFPAFCRMSCGRMMTMNELSLREVDESGCIFMRWKERSFVSKLSRGQFSSLTIAGFYYICLDRTTGAITGSYCDPAKGGHSHIQQLRAKPSNQRAGYSFGTVSFS